MNRIVVPPLVGITTFFSFPSKADEVETGKQWPLISLSSEEVQVEQSLPQEIQISQRIYQDRKDFTAEEIEEARDLDKICWVVRSVRFINKDRHDEDCSNREIREAQLRNKVCHIDRNVRFRSYENDKIFPQWLWIRPSPWQPLRPNRPWKPILPGRPSCFPRCYPSNRPNRPIFRPRPSRPIFRSRPNRLFRR